MQQPVGLGLDIPRQLAKGGGAARVPRSAGPHAAAKHEPGTPRTWLWVPWLLLIPVGYTCLAWGLNAELLGGLNFHPFRYVQPNTLAGAEVACHGGGFHQPLRPIFGLCWGDLRLPVLFNSYTSALVYWPIIGLAQLVPPLHGPLIRFVPFVFIAGFLWMFQRLLIAPRAAKSVAVLAPILLTLIPTFYCYGTLYLYEYFGCYAVLAAWLLLLRWNRGGRTWNVVVAALLMGAAVGTKLTYVLIILPFLVAFLAVCGLRFLSVRRIAWCALAGLVGPGLFLAASLADDPPLAFLAGGGGAAQTHLTVLLGNLILGFRTPVPWLAGDVVVACRFVLALAVLGYAAHRARRHWRDRADEPTVAVAALALVGSLPLYVILYRHNATSVPHLQFMPWLAVVAAAGLLDLSRWIETRIQRRFVAPALVTVGLAAVLAAAGALPIGLYGSVRSFAPHNSFAEQRHVVKQLEAAGVRQPLLPRSDLAGVLEFISEGRVRPALFPVGADADAPIDWRAVAAQPDRDAQDVLFPEESDVSGGFNAPGRVRAFAVSKADFIRAFPAAKAVTVTSTGGTPMYTLYRVRPMRPDSGPTTPPAH